MTLLSAQYFTTMLAGEEAQGLLVQATLEDDAGDTLTDDAGNTLVTTQLEPA